MKFEKGRRGVLSIKKSRMSNLAKKVGKQFMWKMQDKLILKKAEPKRVQIERQNRDYN